MCPIYLALHLMSDGLSDGRDVKAAISDFVKYARATGIRTSRLAGMAPIAIPVAVNPPSG